MASAWEVPIFMPLCSMCRKSGHLPLRFTVHGDSNLTQLEATRSPIKGSFVETWLWDLAGGFARGPRGRRERKGTADGRPVTYDKDVCKRRNAVECSHKWVQGGCLAKAE